MTYTLERPTNREIDKKIKGAKKAIDEKRTSFANLAKMYSDITNLDIGDTDEVWPLIKDLLEELSYEDYCGGHPPESARETEIEGHDLYAFAWESTKCQKRMYLKFALMDGYFHLVSIHESRR